MSIRFKFKSCKDFDTIKTGDKAFITVVELRKHVMSINNLKQWSSEFVLLFYDDTTNQEYEENSFIVAGSTVIIKRAPNHRLRRHHCEDATKGMHVRKAVMPTCPICRTYIKDAMMIPCCHYSFCKSCIRKILMATKICPLCFSNKYGVSHLVPNLSLRDFIDNAEATPKFNSENYASDAESCVNGEKLFNMTKLIGDTPQVGIREEGGNRNDVVHHRNKKSRRSCYMCGSPGHFIRDCPMKYQQSRRSCYMCGSPGHFIRDCPMKSIKHPIFHTGDQMYGGIVGLPMPYWNAAAFPHVNPCGVPPYIQSTYGNRSAMRNRQTEDIKKPVADDIYGGR